MSPPLNGYHSDLSVGPRDTSPYRVFQRLSLARECRRLSHRLLAVHSVLSCSISLYYVLCVYRLLYHLDSLFALVVAPSQPSARPFPHPFGPFILDSFHLLFLLASVRLTRLGSTLISTSLFLAACTPLFVSFHQIIIDCSASPSSSTPLSAYIALALLIKFSSSPCKYCMLHLLSGHTYQHVQQSDSLIVLFC